MMQTVTVVLAVSSFGLVMASSFFFFYLVSVSKANLLFCGIWFSEVNFLVS